MTQADGNECNDSYTYDARGYLLSAVSHAWDESTSEKSYSYDKTSRLAKMAGSHGELTTFDYDKRGHKTKTRVVKNPDERKIPKAIGIDVKLADIESTALLEYSVGGNANTSKTIYNNPDQSTETRTSQPKRKPTTLPARCWVDLSEPSTKREES